MDVSEHVQLGLDAVEDSLSQLLTTHWLLIVCHIENAVWRAVGYEYVSVKRDLIPHFPEALTSIKVESPVEEPRLPGTSVYF